MDVVLVSGLGPGALEAPEGRIHVVIPAAGGNVQVVLHGRDGLMPVRAPQIAVLSDATPHEVRWSEDAALVTLALDAGFFAACCRAELGTLCPIVDARCDEDAFLRHTGEIVQRALREHGDVAGCVATLARVVAVHIALEYDRHVADGIGLAPEPLRRVLRYVEQNLGRPLPLAHLAALAQVSACYFQRKFKQSTGRTPHRFVTEARIARARELLTGTRMPLVDVAACVGYETQAHFTATFHRHVGTTPLRYRRGAGCVG